MKFESAAGTAASRGGEALKIDAAIDFPFDLVLFFDFYSETIVISRT